MKRHSALIPLSRDHHDGLVQAVRLRRAAAGGDASARLSAARDFGEFLRNEGPIHLRDARALARLIVERLRREHASAANCDLRAAAAWLA